MSREREYLLADLADRESHVDKMLEAAEESMLAALGDAAMLSGDGEVTHPAVLVLRRHIAAIREARDEVSLALSEAVANG